LGPLGVILPGQSLHHLYVIRVDGRDELQNQLAQHGIGSKVHWPQSLDQLPGPWVAPVECCPRARSWARQVLSLPCYPGLSDAEIDRVISCVLRFHDACRASIQGPSER
jgi:dTDP-3-amino-2,3,6-trideoxy-4-keto-D-glucose/dTDP-3-amino-3,4,6-trideoxy-alpha-D-glucose/dTDP-2,6-dideoxy-D-kanosamine transaminase